MSQPSKRRRVALIALHYAEYSGNLALALAVKCDVLLILYRGDAENELGTGWREYLTRPTITLVVLDRPKSAASVLSNVRSLVRAVKQYRPDVVHCQEEFRDELVFALFFLRRFPNVLTVHDPRPHSGNDARRFRFSRFRIYRPLMRGTADAVITHGQWLADELTKVTPRFAGRISLLPHGPLGPRDDSATAKRPSANRLLFFGRIHEYKGLRYFVEAIIALRDEGYLVIGVVAGRGGDLDRWRSRMEEAGCFEILDGYVPSAAVPALFTNARAVVLPYIDGTQSGVAAMALGFARPVIATRVGSIPELVRDGQNGLLIAPANVPELVSAIKKVISDDQLWDKLADGACTLRDGELSWRSIGNQTLDVYETLLRQNSP